MGGWLEWPADKMVYQPGSLHLPLRVKRRLLNEDRDPDISFAYFFSGSLGSTDAANETAERGRSKARFEETFVNNDALNQWQSAIGSLFLVRNADAWEGVVEPDGHLQLPPQTLQGGKGRTAWTATFRLATSGSVDAEVELDGSDLVVCDRLPGGTDLRKWAKQAASKLAKADAVDREANRKIAATGVMRRRRDE